jgi:4-amino-4-deoxy-L-arabinose transferase-like glycosyltransferase
MSSIGVRRAYTRFLNPSWAKRNIALTVIIAILAIMVVTPSMSMGIGLSPDSVNYISTARGMLGPFGAQVPPLEMPWIPASHFPPLFPALLAAVSLLFKIDPLPAARWLNTLLFVANVSLAGFIVRRYTGSSLAVIVAALFFLMSRTVLEIHSMVWSEPIFILLSLLAVILLCEYAVIQKRSYLILAGFAVSLSLLARYVGIALVLTGVAGLCLFSVAKWRTRLWQAFIVAVVGLVPLMVWYTGVMMTVQSADRAFAYHPVTFDNLKIGVSILASWLFINGAPPIVEGLVVGSLAVALPLLTIVVQRKKNRQALSARPELARLPYGLLLFMGAYLVCLVLSISFLDAATFFDSRILSPIYVAALILIVCLSNDALCLWRSQRLKISLAVICVTLGALFAFDGVTTVARNHDDGQGFVSGRWRQSAVIAQLKALPAGTIIFSNEPEAIYILTDRPAVLIPGKANPVTLQSNQAFSSDLMKMKQQLEDGHGVLAYFKPFTYRWYMPSASELEQQLPLVLIVQDTNGSLYMLGGANTQQSMKTASTAQ